MRCGLFGKLPAKRDFIALDVPRGFLTLWEGFLQQSLAGSQAYLSAPVWREAYQSAAIWRFWLGPDLCGGMPFLGALMPSVDALGRQFPLSLIAFDPDAPVKPPGAASYEAWFDAVEQFLLSALDAELEFSPGPCLETLALTALSADGPVCEAPMVLVGDDEIRLEESSFWWTIGGAAFESAAFRVKGLPDCEVFANMLTGRFPDMSTSEPRPGAGAL